MILLSIQQLGAQLISSANKPWCPWFPNLTPPWRHQALRRILYRPKAAGMSGAPGNGQKVAVWISTDGDSDICPWISMDQYLYINTSKYWEYHFVGGWTSSYTSEILDHQVFDDFWPISQQTSPSAWPYSQPSAAARWCSGWCAWCGKQARFFWERNRWTAWWFVHSVGNVIIPTDEVIFFRGVGWNHQPVMGMLAETGEKSSKKCCLKCVGAPQVPNILQLPKKIWPNTASDSKVLPISPRSDGHFQVHAQSNAIKFLVWDGQGARTSLPFAVTRCFFGYTLGNSHN